MENTSRLTIDDSSTSMYFSFNSTTAFRNVGTNNNSMEVEDVDDGDQNITLEAGESNCSIDMFKTIKKQSYVISPAKGIGKIMLKSCKVVSSTPTKTQLLRSVEVNRGSNADNDCDLGLTSLEVSQTAIGIDLLEGKENRPQESKENCPKTSSERALSVIEKTQDCKIACISNLTTFKIPEDSKIRGHSPKVCKFIPRRGSDHPSRIATSKGMSNMSNPMCQQIADFNTGHIPKMISSILKISHEIPSTRKSVVNQENPFNLLGKSTTMSIVKTTLNAPARRSSQKSLSLVQVEPNNQFPNNRDKNIPLACSAKSSTRKIGVELNNRKSMLPTIVTSPKKRNVAINFRNSKEIVNSKVVSAKPKPKLITLSGIKDDLVCDICSRKFLVFSLFEVHKKGHDKISPTFFNKQPFSSENNKCQYCDKKFAIAKALANHLMQHCIKIPPAEKKKFLFSTEFKNSVQSQSTLQPRLKPKFSKYGNFPSKQNQESQHQSNAVVAPSAINKLKQKRAHSGVFCTPSKQVTCHTCKTSFSNILAFTEHKLSHTNVVAVGRKESI